MLRLLVVGALLSALPAAAQEPVRYVSDEIPIVLRAGPSPDSAAAGSLPGGARLDLLETAGGYARVRAADGREGWVPQRYLESDPPARQRVQRVEEQLAEARQALAQSQAALKQLQVEQDKLLQDFSRIAESGGAAAAPPALVREAEELREKVRMLEQEHAKLTATRQGDAALERRRTMLTGGSLVAGGALLMLLLHWLWPKRRGF